MIIIKRYIGVVLIVIGTILLMVSYVLGWTAFNLVLLTGLIIIILGVFWHVRHAKSAEKY